MTFFFCAYMEVGLGVSGAPGLGEKRRGSCFVAAGYFCQWAPRSFARNRWRKCAVSRRDVYWFRRRPRGSQKMSSCRSFLLLGPTGAAFS